MNDYLLFIDTEASGLPKKWDLPYSATDNWPHCVQVAWIVYESNGTKIKEENYYIRDNDFEIEASATRVHGITRDFLDLNGISRIEVMNHLVNDVKKYSPLIVGHFIQFDAHMIGADSYRTGIDNPISKENSFCTMIASKHLVQNPAVTFLRLGDLYETLFHKKLNSQHNALEDAKATAACFFELLRRGDITKDTIALQQKDEQQKANRKDSGCVFPFLFIISIVLLTTYFL